MKVEFSENKTENELQSKARVKVSNDRNEKMGEKMTEMTELTEITDVTKNFHYKMAE